jgi:hypothetical protein
MLGIEIDRYGVTFSNSLRFIKEKPKKKIDNG